MKRTRLVSLAAMPAFFMLSGCTLHGQASDPAAPFVGDWQVDKSFGVTPPNAWTMHVEHSGRQLTIRSHWEEPKDGQYGLTLIGLTTHELVLDTTGAQQSMQAGPFVFHHASRWEGGKLVTRWSTSEYMGSSVQGTWTRAMLKDGNTETLDIDATSSGGQVSRARLMLRRTGS